MKYINCIFGIFLVAITGYANAYIVKDVRTFDAIYTIDEPFHLEYNLADYGFVPGRDRLIGQPLLTLEIRDPDYWPGKDWSEQPFLMILIDRSRYFTRVGNEDWEERGFFNEDGVMPVDILFDYIDVWLGDVTLSVEFAPGPARLIPEPAPFILIAIGLVALGFSRAQTRQINY